MLVGRSYELYDVFSNIADLFPKRGGGSRDGLACFMLALRQQLSCGACPY